MPKIVLPLECRADHIILDKNAVLPKIPEADIEGRVLTLNQTGFMQIHLDGITLSFIEAAKSTDLPVLEIGTAYGCATRKILANDATVVANDVDMRHLLLLREQVEQKYWPKLYLNHASFPETTNFPKNCFSHILLSRVAHFLTPAAMEIAFDKVEQWLAPGGLLYFVVMSPYQHRLQWFLPTYEKRWQQGIVWPGMIDDTKRAWPEFANDIPPHLHVMDERPFMHAMQKRAFTIKHSELFDYNHVTENAKNYTKGYFGAIAMKNAN